MKPRTIILTVITFGAVLAWLKSLLNSADVDLYSDPRDFGECPYRSK